jgi:hypothetical protein
MSFYKPVSRWKKKRRTNSVFNKLVAELNQYASCEPGDAVGNSNTDVHNQLVDNHAVPSEDHDVAHHTVSSNMCDEDTSVAIPFVHSL